MIAALLFVSALPQDAPAAHVAESAQAQEIVVIARKLKDWRASVRFKDGKGFCRTRRSTGDAEIDRIGCDAMLQCFPRFMPRLEAARAKTLSADARKTMTDTANRELTACVEERHATLSAELADRRAGAGGQ